MAAREAISMHILVTSGSGANGNGHGYGAILGFSPEGDFAGPFTSDRGSPIRAACRLTHRANSSMSTAGTTACWRSISMAASCATRGRYLGWTQAAPSSVPTGVTTSPCAASGQYVRCLSALTGRENSCCPRVSSRSPAGSASGTTAGYTSPLASLHPDKATTPSWCSTAAGTLLTPHLVTAPELSPLDLKLAPNGNIVVASEWPFGASDAASSVREYDPLTGELVRVFAAERSVGLRRPRGLRFGPDGRLYCVGEHHIVAFDFVTGSFSGPVVHLERLSGQALVLVP